MSLSQTFDSRKFRHVLGHYPTGVCVVTAHDDDGLPVGMTVGSFTSVSLHPPLVAFFPDKKSTSWPRIASVGKFCVNVLGDSQHDVCRVFASSGGNKFAEVRHRTSVNGSPILDGVLAWIDCALYATFDAGDHVIALGEVKGLEVESPGGPLLFFQGSYGEFARMGQPGHGGPDRG